jgi:cytochrome c551/c552
MAKTRASEFRHFYLVNFARVVLSSRPEVVAPDRGTQKLNRFREELSMRRLDLCLLVSGVLVVSACGSSTPSNTGKGGTGGASGTGGATAGVGGGGTGGGGTGGGGTGGGTAGGGSGGGGTAGGGSAGGGATGTAGMDAGAGMDGSSSDTKVDMAMTETSTDTSEAGTDVPLTATQERGLYLVGVLGCTGCHGSNLAGKDGFITASTGNLSSANLTNDATGLKNFSDQTIINAFTMGIDPDSPDGGTQYLFAQMPWYQFANLSATDAQDIVDYLRTVTAVSHTPAANTGNFATQPTAPQWTPVTLASLPNSVAPDAGADAGSDAATASESNGKYFAALLCVTCHTVDTSATSPLMLDATKAFQGGRNTSVTLTVPVDGGADAGDAGDAGDAATTMMVTENIESANLTPDSTGLSGWTPAQIVTAITAGTDNMSRTICGMRKNAAITTQDAMDIATYLQAIPAVANAPSPTCY